MGRKEFLKDLDMAREVYPFLEYEYIEDKVYPYKITDDFEITDDEGNHWGTFRASVYFHHTYPKGFAVLVDESKSFPWKIDWHTSDNGECCVCSPLENIKMTTKPITILSFIENYVLRFYANQIYRREYGQYKNGEYSHNAEGVWEVFEEEFHTTNRKEIFRLIHQMNIKRGRNELCFCGSGKKYKNCHIYRCKDLLDLSKSIV